MCFRESGERGRKSVVEAHDALLDQARDERGREGLGIRADVPAIARRHGFGVAERAHAQRRLGRQLAVDLNQRGDGGQVILLADRGKRLLEEGLKALLGPRE